MPIGQSGIGPPHDTLQFPELGKEAWSLVVDFGCVECDCTLARSASFKNSELTLSMIIGLDVPQRVIISGVLVACNLIVSFTPRTRWIELTSCCSNPHSGSLTLCENR